MLWPGHNNFKSSQKAQQQFWTAPHNEDAHHMDSLLDSELDANLAKMLADVIIKKQCPISKKWQSTLVET